jgi:hypothetical protein
MVIFFRTSPLTAELIIITSHPGEIKNVIPDSPVSLGKGSEEAWIRPIPGRC